MTLGDKATNWFLLRIASITRRVSAPLVREEHVCGASTGAELCSLELWAVAGRQVADVPTVYLEDTNAKI